MNHDQKVARAAAVQIVPPKLVHHGDRAVTANVVHDATDLKQVRQCDPNEVTETKPVAKVVVAPKHHQNRAALVEALKKADAALPQIADIAKSDRKHVKTVQVAVDLAWIAVKDIVPLKLLSKAPVAGDPILMLTHGTVDQVIDDRALAPIVEITDRSSVHTAVTSVTVDLTLDIMPMDMVVTTPGSTHDMVQYTTVDSAHKVVNTDQSLNHTAVTSAPANPTLDIMPVDMAIISAPILAHDTVARCLDIISVHEMATVAHISAHAV